MVYEKFFYFFSNSMSFFGLRCCGIITGYRNVRKTEVKQDDPYTKGVVYPLGEALLFPPLTLSPCFTSLPAQRKKSKEIGVPLPYKTDDRIVASCFGIFFSSEDTGSTQTMQQVVQEINLDYQNKLDEIKSSNTYDELEMSGSRAVWPEVLSIYAVKTTNDPDNPQEVASMTDEKKQLLKDIFWEMNEISYETEEKTETVIVETDDGEGNIIEEEVEETTVYLYITVSHKTVEEMMAQYGFTEDQKAQVAELLAQDSSMWASVLYGIYGADDQIVAVALSQLGNVGGEPYWSWYGFGSRVEWCACFVSWCADQCGYIETGVIPKYAGCVNGVNWFKDRGQWADNDIEPAPGMIIFFDWDNKGSSGPQDGESDHTGIVERVEDGIVYTVEGNSGDSCRENH